MLVAASPAPPVPLSSPLAEASFWPLDPSYDFLNHGSFGSVPWTLQECQRGYRDLIEAKPIEMLGRRCRELLARPREALAALVGADAAGLGFVTNATEGVNAVLRSLELRPGDVLVTTDHVYNAVRQTMRYVARRAGAELRVVEIPLPLVDEGEVVERIASALELRPGDVLVTTDHVYNAVRQTMRYVARRAGAELRIVEIPLPLNDEGEVVERIASALDPRTRLVVVDHITSPTALVLPIEDIVRLCADRGVECLVDGAHAPGMLELDVRAMGPTYYTGNLHKWVCAPKGCGFLWVNESRRRDVHPATVSHFLDEGFDTEFDWQGTRDISAWLTIPDAIAMWETVGWQRMREHNHGLARWVRGHLCERFGTRPIAAAHARGGRGLNGSMTTVRLPDGLQTRFPTVEAMQAALYDQHRIEIPIIAWGGHWHCRASCQVYNRTEQYQRLADAVLSLAGGETA